MKDEERGRPTSSVVLTLLGAVLVIVAVGIVDIMVESALIGRGVVVESIDRDGVVSGPSALTSTSSVGKSPTSLSLSIDVQLEV